VPANLTPQYHKAEREYRTAETAVDRVQCLETMLRIIPKHKGTDRLQGELRAKLKEARVEVQVEASAPKSTRTFRISKQGAGTVFIIGPPNSGKSRLVAELTNAEPNVEPYPFTTREPLSAMMPVHDVMVQLVDTPPVTASNLEPYLLNFVRSSELTILCFNGSSDDAPQEVFDVIEQFRQRKTVLSAESGFDDDDFSIVHVPTLLVLTHAADEDVDIRREFFSELSPPELPIALVDFDQGIHIEELRAAIYEALSVIRVYTKRPGQSADSEAPLTFPQGATVEDFALKLHQDLFDTLQFAKVLSRGSDNYTRVNRDYELSDGDTVELHCR